MKKISLISTCLVLMFAIAVPMAAQGYYDMHVGTIYRDYWTNTSGGDYVYGRLTNHDEQYGDNGSGQARVYLDENNLGNWTQLCIQDEYLSPGGDYVQCSNNWHNKNEDFRTAGKYSSSSTGKSIWSELE